MKCPLCARFWDMMPNRAGDWLVLLWGDLDNKQINRYMSKVISERNKCLKDKGQRIERMADGFIDRLPRERPSEVVPSEPRPQWQQAIQAKIWQKLFQAEITISLVRKYPCHSFQNILPSCLGHPFHTLWGHIKSITVCFIKMGANYSSPHIRIYEGHANRVLHTHPVARKKILDVLLYLWIVTSHDLDIVFIFLIYRTSRTLLSISWCLIDTLMTDCAWEGTLQLSWAYLQNPLIIKWTFSFKMLQHSVLWK